MFFSLLISILFWQTAHAMSPDERAEQREIEIKKQCKPRMLESEASYYNCVAKGGIQAEAIRQQEEKDAPVVCNPSGALKACSAASDTAAKINNPNAPDVEVEEAIVNCRFACNPQSPKVLSNYLSGCGSSAKAQTDQMKVYLNKCGYAISASQKESIELIENEPVGTSLADRVIDLLPAKIKEIGFETGLLGGKSESTLNSFANVSSVPLHNGIDYVKTTTRDGVSYTYRKNNIYYDSYGEAAGLNRGVHNVNNGGGGGIVGGRAGAPSPTLPSSGDSLLDDGIDDRDTGVTATPNAEARTSAPEESLVPRARPDDFRAPPGEGRKETAGGGDGGSHTGGGNGGNPPKDPVVRDSAPQPLVEGNDGAFVNNALNFPQKSGGGMQPVSVGDSSEISSGGGSSPAGYAGVGGGGSSSRGSNFQGSGQQPALVTNDSPTLHSTSGGVGGDTNLNGNLASGSRGGGGAGSSDAGGVRVASARTAAPTVDGFGFHGTKPDPNNYYKTSGKAGAAPSRARLVKVDPNCKGKNCKWKTASVAGDSSAVNCEGNPQCLLALTGPLSAKKKKKTDEFFQAQNPGSVGRGVASDKDPVVKSASIPKCVTDGDCWTGLDAVVLHKNIIDRCFQLDYAGDLKSVCEGY